MGEVLDVQASGGAELGSPASMLKVGRGGTHCDGCWWWGSWGVGLETGAPEGFRPASPAGVVRTRFSERPCLKKKMENNRRRCSVLTSGLHTCTHGHVQLHTHAQHTRTGTRTLVHTHMHTQTHTYLHRHTHAHSCTHTGGKQL